MTAWLWSCWDAVQYNGIRKKTGGCPEGSLPLKFMMRLRRSDVEEEVHDVAVLNDVVLAFGAHLAGFLSALFTLEGDEVFVGDRLGADEAAFEVGVDDAGGLRGRCRPCGSSRRGLP